MWELTTPALDAGAYRYNFNVDGVATIDPRNPSISESNTNVWSLVYVPGSYLFVSKAVPHGAVAEVTYKSSALGRDRRMHVYTPPGYQNGRDRYPVFYLLHGAGDNDDSWTTVGRAGFILDNLIAAQQARPMVVVMPAGHASTSQANVVGRSATDDFVNDFVKDVMPYVEKNYRVLTDRPNTAIAGFSTAVIDNREMYANRERFPEAGEIYAEEYEDVFAKLTINSSSYIIIVTRGHRDDMRVLRWAVLQPARYIAVIGSKRKVIGVVKELEREGLAPDLFDKIFGPMGLDIGAITPEEIAVSVVAEMIAMRRQPEANWRTLSKSIFAHEKIRVLATR